MKFIGKTHPVIPEMLNITVQSIKYPNSWICNALLKVERFVVGMSSGFLFLEFNLCIPRPVKLFWLFK